MRSSSWIIQYVVAAVVFTLIDFGWLTVVAEDLYAEQLGALLADPPNVPAAVAFYVIFIAGLVFFVVHPAVEAGSWRRALLAGGFFGLVTYATWDLTNLAVIRGFPATLVPIDLAWGATLAALVSLTTYAICRRLPS
jgi:uncharacterized membrane protein